jgi:arginine-tRNA-protein transferase
MLILQQPALSDPAPCPYIAGNTAVYEYFFALQLDGAELAVILGRGWRKFGLYYFRPACPGCAACIPIRVRTREFEPGKPFRRVLRKNGDVSVRFGPLSYRPEIYGMYLEHSRSRFGNETPEDEFLFSFYRQSCPALQSEYYLDGKLMAVGFLDRGEDSLSSVYFIYRDGMGPRSPGTFSIIREIGYARELELPYYYLGYYVRQNSRMAYKGRFRPHETFSWEEGVWGPAA